MITLRPSLTPRRRVALAATAAAVFLVSWVATAAADPPDPNDQDVDVGSTGSNGLNAVDNVVHPTPTMSTATILPTGHETDVANPAQFALWRGGCGTDTFVDHFATDGLDPEGISGQRAHVLDANGGETGAQVGLSHVYADSVLARSVHICAIYYDVHGTAS